MTHSRHRPLSSATDFRRPRRRRPPSAARPGARMIVHFGQVRVHPRSVLDARDPGHVNYFLIESFQFTLGSSMTEHDEVRIMPTAGVRLSRRRLLALAAATTVATGVAVRIPAADAASAEAGFPAGRFADPRPDSRPTVLWFWNGTVTPDLVAAGLADLRGQGVYEVLLFPFETAALKPAFFSEE